MFGVLLLNFWLAAPAAAGHTRVLRASVISRERAHALASLLEAANEHVRAPQGGAGASAGVAAAVADARIEAAALAEKAAAEAEAALRSEAEASKAEARPKGSLGDESR